MTDTFQTPLTEAQEARAAAVTLAANAISYDRPLNDLFDVADYIVNGDECPFAALKEPASVSFDLSPVSDDALRILFGVKPAEPEVITAKGVDALDSLPLGSVVEFPGVGRYFHLSPGRWTHEAWLGAKKPHGIPACALSSSTHVLVEYIPGGV